MSEKSNAVRSSPRVQPSRSRANPSSAAQNSTIQASTDKEDQARPLPIRTGGPLSAYGVDRQGQSRPTGTWSTTRGGNQRPARSTSSPTTTASSHPRRSRWCASSSRTTRSSRSTSCSGTPDQHGGAEVPQPEEGAAALRRDGRLQVGHAPRSSRGPWAGSPTTPTEARDLRQAHPRQPQGARRSAWMYQNDDSG